MWAKRSERKKPSSLRRRWRLKYIDNRYIIIHDTKFQKQMAQDLYDGNDSRSARKIPIELHVKTKRLFDQINAATKIDTLRVPPGNHLEKLKGNLKDYWSIRINKQWRIVFKWENGEALNVDVIDYH